MITNHGMRLCLIMFPHTRNMATEKRAMGTRYEVATSFHIWKLGQTYRTLRAETTRMHTIPARPSPPTKATNPHALQKGHPHHTCLLEYSSTLYACLHISIHYARVKIARPLLYSIDTLDSTIIYHHLPHIWKSKYAFNWGTILSYQVKFSSSMTNSVPSSSDTTLMTKRFAPTTILRRFIVIRYRSQDKCLRRSRYRSIQCLIASGKALLIHCEHHSLCA